MKRLKLEKLGVNRVVVGVRIEADTEGEEATFDVQLSGVTVEQLKVQHLGHLKVDYFFGPYLVNARIHLLATNKVKSRLFRLQWLGAKPIPAEEL